MDRRVTPEEERTFHSINGKFVLNVITLDHWKTRNSTAILTLSGKEIWRKKLPHSHGPREATVTNGGTVVLFDEWINIKSDYAVSIISKSGQFKRTWTFEEIRGIVNQPLKEFTSFAKLGPWMGGKPSVSGESIQVSAGGNILVIDTKSLNVALKSR